jgi:putative ABC transport system permease protein
MTTIIRIAWRNLIRNRRRTIFVMAALVVGMSAITAFRSFLNAMHYAQMENQLKGRYGFLQVHKKGFLANVLANPLQFNFADTPDLREKILAVRGITAIAPRIDFSAMYSGPEQDKHPARTAFFAITAMDPKAEARVSPRIMDNIRVGRMLSDLNARELVLNLELAEGLGASVVQDGSLSDESLWPVVLTNDIDGSMNGEISLVVGHLAPTMPGDNRYGLMTLGTAQRLLRLEGRVTEYAIGATDLKEVPRIQRELEVVLGPEFEVQRWDQVAPLLKQLLELTSSLFNIITAVFMTIVLLGLVNVMLMNVLERVREIGTMMAVGTRRATILWLFLIEGGTIGFFGGLVGLAVGCIVVLVLNRQGFSIAPPGNDIPLLLRPFVTPAFLLGMEAFSVTGAVLASLWPAMKASRLNPVEALSQP